MKSWPPSRHCSRLKTKRAFRDKTLNSKIRQRVADGIDDLDQAGMRTLKLRDRRREAIQGQFQKLGILLLARGLVGGQFSEPGDALRLLGMSFGQLGDLGFQRR